VKWKASSLVPVLICAAVTTSACLLEWLDETDNFTLLQRVEWITYDWRVRMAARHNPAAATNLGFVFISDESIEAVLDGMDGALPYRYGLQWPRQVYGRLVHELREQGATAIGFDIVFAEERPDHAAVLVNEKEIPSDEFFARELAAASDVILPAEKSLVPTDLFRTNAWVVADISARREVDGILRRARAFSSVTVWHPTVRRAARKFGWKIAAAQVEHEKIVFPREDSDARDVLPLNGSGQFNAAQLEAALQQQKSAEQKWEQPFEVKRLWQLGISLAARQLNLDLERARIHLDQGIIEIPGADGMHIIPIDRQGRVYIDWSITPTDRRLTKEAIEYLLEQYELRRAGKFESVTNRWAGKLAVIGSTATGNNLTDMGATPLEHETYLVAQHWNVANSLLVNRFIRPLSLSWKLLLTILFGIVATLLTLHLRPLHAVLAVAGIAAGYVTLACWAFMGWRVWLPIVLPVGLSLMLTHVSLVVYLVRLEQQLRRRTKDIFSKVVSPDVVRELLEVERLSLGGTRRCVTVFFADVRGFTAVTDSSQQRAERFVTERGLVGDAAQKYFDSEAEAVLNAVNPYLSILADVIKQHDGTLDKYIGDCVMAFWGAPVKKPRHAVCCVHAAIEAQRAIFEFNQQRIAENERRAGENIRRATSGKEPMPMLEVLTLGTGINTGFVNVGMVGSEAHLMNYTIFGREVNLASRLESASGRARILISESTYQELLRDEPELAAACREQEPLELKGFLDRIKAYEVPWRADDVAPVEAGQSATIVRDMSQRKDCY
jgi:class 3 adenylate cyclase/CHASE2 domain-containing sensor protein